MTEVGWEDRVRNLLGVEDMYLTDEDIRHPEIIDLAEAEMVARFPNYATLTGPFRVWLEAATVSYCAMLLCPTMKARLPVREQSLHLNRELTVDWDKRKEELFNEIERFSYFLDGSTDGDRYILRVY